MQTCTGARVLTRPTGTTRAVPPPPAANRPLARVRPVPASTTSPRTGESSDATLKPTRLNASPFGLRSGPWHARWPAGTSRIGANGFTPGEYTRSDWRTRPVMASATTPSTNTAANARRPLRIEPHQHEAEGEQVEDKQSGDRGAGRRRAHAHRHEAERR